MSVSVVSKRRSNLGEGPHWDFASNTLLHVDPHLGDVCRLDVVSRETESIHLDGLVTIAVPYSSNPELNVITVGRQVRQLNWKTKQTEVLAEVDQHRPTNHFNDGKCDVTGRLWAGAYGVSGTRGEEKGPDDIDPEKGTLYSFDPPCMQPKAHVHKISISNGMTWTPDNKKMFYIDSFTRIIYSFDFNSTNGELTNQQVFLNFNEREEYKTKGYPDGMTNDVEGKLWVACYDAARVIRIDPETGTLLREVTFPATKITSCCFGGWNYDELYVTSAWRGLSGDERKAQPDAGSVFKVTQLGTKGLRPYTLNI